MKANKLILTHKSLSAQDLTQHLGISFQQEQNTPLLNLIHFNHKVSIEKLHAGNANITLNRLSMYHNPSPLFNTYNENIAIPRYNDSNQFLNYIFRSFNISNTSTILETRNYLNNLLNEHTSDIDDFESTSSSSSPSYIESETPSQSLQEMQMQRLNEAETHKKSQLFHEIAFSLNDDSLFLKLKYETQQTLSNHLSQIIIDDYNDDHTNTNIKISTSKQRLKDKKTLLHLCQQYMRILPNSVAKKILQNISEDEQITKIIDFHQYYPQCFPKPLTHTRITIQKYLNTINQKNDSTAQLCECESNRRSHQW